MIAFGISFPLSLPQTYLDLILAGPQTYLDLILAGFGGKRHLVEVVEVGVQQGLAGRDPLGGVVDQHLQRDKIRSQNGGGVDPMSSKLFFVINY